VTACPAPSRHTEWIDLVLARCGDLRRAGVLAIGCDGLTAQLAPWIEPPTADKDAAAGTDETPLDFMNDPASYADGVVPGYEIEKFTPEGDY
jgi:hypothetical protein